MSYQSQGSLFPFGPVSQAFTDAIWLRAPLGRLEGGIVLLSFYVGNGAEESALAGCGGEMCGRKRGRWLGCFALRRGVGGLIFCVDTAPG